MVASCPNCSKPIPDDHSLAWCMACGEPLPETIQLRLTKLQEVRMNAAAARAGRVALRPEPEVEESCSNCGKRFRASASLDSLGFRELTCPNCHRRAITPLRWSYRITYWVFLCLWVSGWVLIFSHRTESLIEPESAVALSGALLLVWYLLSAILKDLRVVCSRLVSGQR